MRKSSDDCGSRSLLLPGTLIVPAVIGHRGIADAGIILCMHPANERRRYDVTSSLIGWAHTQNDPCDGIHVVAVGLSLRYQT